MKRKVLFSALAVTVVLVMLLTAACQPKTVVIEREVEKIITQVVKEVVKETVKETVIVEGTPKVVEKEVTKVVEKEVVVEVTPTPEPLVGPMKPVPRNRTVILGAWEHAAQLAGTDNFNPIINTASLRTNYAKWIYEALMYYNMTTGEEYPWLAESYELADDYTGLTINLRKGVEWADGEPFTCDDVKFTIEAHRDTETARWRGYFSQWLDTVECIDDFTAKLTYTGPNPRFHQKILIGWENHFTIAPEHIFADKDIATFTNLDLGQGWPMGTGPYKLILVSPQQVIYDRRDDWWGAKIGFQEMPIPERIIGTNAASDEAYAQLYMTNKLDFGGFALQLGSFEAAKEKNPTVRSWYDEGPVYGAPDGCMYQLSLNNLKYSDVNVRLALNYALDRQEVVELAYQGATFPKAYPISMYVMGAWGDILQPIIDKWDRGTPSQEKVEEHMDLAGYSKNADGLWEKDGEVLDITIQVPVPWAPLGPVLAEQFTRAGFKAEEHLDTAGQWGQLLNQGESDATAFVHCGSNFDPYDSFDFFRSKCSVPAGDPEQGCGVFHNHRYAGDPRLDELIESMEVTPPDVNNPEYVEWAKEALDIYLRDMPTLIISEELHVITMNEEYWTGWPTANNSYIAPYPCWSDFTLALYKIKPTQ